LQTLPLVNHYSASKINIFWLPTITIIHHRNNKQRKEQEAIDRIQITSSSSSSSSSSSMVHSYCCGTYKENRDYKKIIMMKEQACWVEWKVRRPRERERGGWKRGEREATRVVVAEEATPRAATKLIKWEVRESTPSNLPCMHSFLVLKKKLQQAPNPCVCLHPLGHEDALSSSSPIDHALMKKAHWRECCVDDATKRVVRWVKNWGYGRERKRERERERESERERERKKKREWRKWWRWKRGFIGIERDKDWGSSRSHCICQRGHCPRSSNVSVQPTKMYVA